MRNCLKPFPTDHKVFCLGSHNSLTRKPQTSTQGGMPKNNRELPCPCPLIRLALALGALVWRLWWARPCGLRQAAMDSSAQLEQLTSAPRRRAANAPPSRGGGARFDFQVRKGKRRPARPGGDRASEGAPAGGEKISARAREHHEGLTGSFLTLERRANTRCAANGGRPNEERPGG